jgi:hypothetical protein
MSDGTSGEAATGAIALEARAAHSRISRFQHVRAATSTMERHVDGGHFAQVASTSAIRWGNNSEGIA